MAAVGQSLNTHLQKHPHQLFLIDGIGALLSAFSLGVVLMHWNTVFGMPKDKLFYLAIAPCFFAVYSLFCYFKKQDNWPPFLIFIACANIIYCLITTTLLFTEKASLTTMGYLYFIVEIIIVVSLSIYEIKTARFNKK